MLLGVVTPQVFTIIEQPPSRLVEAQAIFAGGDIAGLVVAQGVGVAMVGVLIGLIASLALTRVLDSMLFGVEATHVATFVGMSAVMAAVALVASYGPARRASGADPIRALRAE